jgi:hypothetical protein
MANRNGKVFFELPQEFGTVIYGSGDRDGVLPRADPASDPFAVLNQVLTFPLRVFNEALTAMAQPAGQQNGDESMKYRRHTPHGEVVQTMSTKTLKAKNIFGSGGSQ